MSVTTLLSPLCSRANVKILLGIAAGDTSEDDLLDLCIDAATGTINDYVQWPLLKPASEPAEYYSGDGSPDVVLRRRPVQSITSVYLDPQGYWGQGSGAFAATTLLTAGVDYALILERDNSKGFAGLLRRINSINSAGGWYAGGGLMTGGTLTSWGRAKSGWMPGEGNIKVTYSAGYTSLTDATFPVPPNVQQACAQLAIWIKKTVPNGGFATVSESLGKYSVSFGQLSQAAGNALAGAGEMGSIRQILSRYRDMAL